MSPTILLSLGLVVAAPLIGRLAGSLASRRRWIESGQARNVMPGLPHESTPAISQLGRRYDFRVEAAAAQIHRKMLSSSTKGVTAEALAAELSLPQEICAAALERLRTRANCHLRVTRSGKLLHDFEESSLRTIRSNASLPWIARLTLFIASLLANIGAIWPLFLSLLGASLALLGVFGEDSSDESWFLAVGVVFAVPMTFALVIAGGVLVGAVLAPLFPSPHLGNSVSPPPKEEDNKDDKKKTTPRLNWQSAVTESDAFGTSEIAKTVISSIFYIDIPVLGLALLCKFFGVSFTYFFIGLGVILLLIALIFAMGSSFDPEALPFVVVALLLAVVVVAFAGIIFWMIGLWRSATRKEDTEMSPGERIQQEVKVDDLAVLVPTNDLVISSYTSLQKALSKERPIDPKLSGRLRVAASERGGRLAAFEITLLEGLDPDEAVAIGAKLASHAGGSIEVSEEGELFFVFPDVLRGDRQEALGECFIKVSEQKFHAPPGIPVTLPGVSLATIEGMERLCAGTFLMFLTLWASTAGVWQRIFGPDAWLARDWMVPASAFLLVGVFALTGAIRYAARVEARASFLRDVRRETFKALRLAVAQNEQIFKAKEFAQNLTDAAKKLWPSLTVEETLKEVEAACDDLRLELSPDELANNKKETRPYALDTLRNRLAAMKHPEVKPASTNQDEVVFDSATLIRR